MSLVIDSHTHVFPDPLGKGFAEFLFSRPLDLFKRKGRSWVRPFSSSLHHVQTSMRHLPESLRNRLDEAGGMASLFGLFWESSVKDLEDAMGRSDIQASLVIAHPPFSTNEFILGLGQQNPSLLPVVNVPKGNPTPGSLLKDFVKRGARAVKIHAASEGEGPDSTHYRALIKAATDEGLPVFLHTGCVHTRLFYKDPTKGKAEIFTRWYQEFSSTQFILAHMNFHDPTTAIDLCEEYPNLWVETSWQPAEAIAEAIRRLGPERILFGSDWPFLGHNIFMGRKRIQEGVESGLMSHDQARLILGENAARLFGWEPYAA